MPPLPLITAQTEEKLLAFLTEHGHTKSAPSRFWTGCGASASPPLTR
ncbi:MAG: hypothetical protein ACLT38_05740 [Akkermansia sp.]